MTRYQVVSIPLIIVIGLITTGSLSYAVYIRNTEKIGFEFQRAASDHSRALQRSIHAAVMAGESVVGLFAASEEVTRDEFNSFAHVLLADIPYIQALEWAPSVKAPDRHSIEQQLANSYPAFHITERDPSGQLVTAELRSEYFPVLYVEPLQGNEKAFGFDLASNSLRAAAITQARDLNLVVASEKITLVQGVADQNGVLLFFPIYVNHNPIETVEQRRDHFLGTVVAVFDVEKLVGSIFDYLQTSDINITVTDDQAPSNNNFIHFYQPKTPDTASTQDELLNQARASDWSFTDVIDVANRHWVLHMTPASGFFNKPLTLEVYIVTLCGVLATILLTAYVRLLQKSAHQLRQDKGLLESVVSERTRELKENIEELEAYSYSIAHDLRSPLRTITSFTQIVMNDAKDKLNDEEKGHLIRVIDAGKYQAQLIDDILDLARIARSKLDIQKLDLTNMARQVADRIDVVNSRGNKISWDIKSGLTAAGDPRLINLVLENLLGNAQKFSSKVAIPMIEFGNLNLNGAQIFYIKDNGAGFDNSYAQKIFGLFQRLHNIKEYEGTGIGLATVQRIIARHGGRIWAEGEQGKGATFFFTLNETVNSGSAG